MAEREHWLRGPMEGIAPPLQPAAHALAQVLEDLPRAVYGITRQHLWVKPGGAASIGFHLKHVAGSLDRLYTYARGEKLTAFQEEALRNEQEPDNRSLDELVTTAKTILENAIGQLRGTHPETLDEVRLVGRAGIPSTHLGLLYHGAEHAQRHLGALIVTSKVVKEYFR